MKSAEKTEKISRMASVFRLAGDPVRLRILCIVFRNRGTCVSDMAKELGMSVQSVSHHLRMMARSGLLVTERDGKSVCYRLSSDAMAADMRKFVCKYR